MSSKPTKPYNFNTHIDGCNMICSDTKCFRVDSARAMHRASPQNFGLGPYDTLKMALCEFLVQNVSDSEFKLS